VAIRVNPNISVKTHEKIATGSNDTKFGMPIEETANIYKRLSSEKNIKTMGLAIHIGSQIFDMNEFKLAYLNILSVANSLRQEGFKVPNLDLGGGLGVDYKTAKINFFDYGKTISDVFKGHDYSLSIEPGRSLVANSGILLTKVIYLKKTKSKNFIIVDGAMNDFIRPTLYNAHHNVEPVNLSKSGLEKFDIVGPICETGDYFAKDALLSKPIEGQLLAIFSTGAYGSVMSSMYNSRVPANEVLVHNGKVHILKEQERIEDQINKEILPRF
jgi:diaminopimelate decarboxylase